jgi:hypothetical protein
MSYRDDLYCAENLIGYTGTLNDFPTVYFHKPSTGEFGHITQRHPIVENVGREVVQTAAGGYHIETEDVTNDNGDVIGKGLAEYNGSHCFHASRSEFIPKDASNEGILLQAIQRFPHEKPIAIWRPPMAGMPEGPGMELIQRPNHRDGRGRRGAISAGETINRPPNQ